MRSTRRKRDRTSVGTYPLSICLVCLFTADVKVCLVPPLADGVGSCAHFTSSALVVNHSSIQIIHKTRKRGWTSCLMHSFSVVSTRFFSLFGEDSHRRGVGSFYKTMSDSIITQLFNGWTVVEITTELTSFKKENKAYCGHGHVSLRVVGGADLRAARRRSCSASASNSSPDSCFLHVHSYCKWFINS
jgi:hypothetical protein